MIRPQVLVVGCGGIGGNVAGQLCEAGANVTAATTNQEIFEVTQSRGFVLRGASGSRTVQVPVHLGIPERAFDFIILATQPPQVEDAARGALAALKVDGVMVCLQNGLCESKIAAIAGSDRTMGAIISWGATMPEPGVYEQTAAGGFTLGRLDGTRNTRLDELALLLEPIGPCEITDNLNGKRWSKLAINCAISSLGTIGGDRLGPLMQHRFVRRLVLEIMTEVVHVARKEHVRLEKVSGTVDLDWIALTDGERASAGSPTLLAKHALLVAVGYRYRRMRSSMLSAIERGRPPAVDFLNGEITSRAKKYGIKVPINEQIRDLVWAISRGEVKASIETARAFYDRTRHSETPDDQRPQ